MRVCVFERETDNESDCVSICTNARVDERGHTRTSGASAQSRQAGWQTCRLQGLGFRVQDLGTEVKTFGFRV